MAIAEISREDLLGKVYQLAAEIEQGREEHVGALLDELTRLRESDLFCQMGHLTRQLHEALNSLHVDANLSSVAEHNIPDAKARLDFVIQKTEEAAHRTLGAVEQTVPLAEQLGVRARDLSEQWRRFQGREMSAAEFRGLSEEIAGFLAELQTQSKTINARLGDVLMAQDYQDLTGQVIRRVIDLVQEVEDNLVGLIRVRGNGTAGAVEVRSKAPANGEGPLVDAAGRTDVVHGQDEVDDLLSSLGF